MNALHWLLLSAALVGCTPPEPSRTDIPVRAVSPEAGSSVVAAPAVSASSSVPAGCDCKNYCNCHGNVDPARDEAHARLWKTCEAAGVQCRPCPPCLAP